MDNNNNVLENNEEGLGITVTASSNTNGGEGNTVIVNDPEQTEQNDGVTENTVPEEGGVESNVDDTELGNNSEGETDTTAIQKSLDERKQVEEDLHKDLSTRGISFDELAKEYDDNGVLSAETYAKLENAGYPKSVVDNYIKGVELEREHFVNHILNVVGGQEQFNKMASFIQSKGQAYVDTFNAMIDSNNVAQVEMAVKGVLADMEYSYGTSKPTLLGNAMGSASLSTIKPFSSRQEMISAMSDPRYGKDRAYTKEIEKRTMKTNF